MTVTPVIDNILVQPVYVLAECTCGSCGLKFSQTFPIGHSIEEQLSIEQSGKKIYSEPQSPPWLSDALKNIGKARHNDVAIEKRIYKVCDSVVVLNTLDYLYGHVLLKLYNAQYHLDHQKDLGLIIIIPRIFEWLIPKGCAEAWIVDLKLSELAYGHDAIQKFITGEFERFNRIYLSKAYSHPDFTTVDISRFTGIKPFNLEYFDMLHPAITFVLREDRWWFSSVWDYRFYRVCRKLKLLPWGSRILSLRQNQLIKKTIRCIQSKLPHAIITIAGLGKTGSFRDYAIDSRSAKADAVTEIEWCQLYAQSHVVVGVHGSNMLLPTALAAGCVEILPEDRYANMVQDISVRYNDRKQLFFYRFADQYAAPRSVSEKVTAIINDFNHFNKSMCLNIYRNGR